MFTLTDNQKLELIEKHLSNRLSAKEQTVFQQLLADDKDFALSVIFQKDLLTSIQSNARKVLKQQFQSLEKTIAVKTTESKISGLDTVRAVIEAEVKQLGYTIDQFIELFRPIPNYTTAIAATTRGSALTLLSPENEVNCTDASIHFVFEKSLQKEVEILIENNQYDILIEETIDAGNKEVTFELSSSDFKAGCYYWKIIEADDLVVMGMFFVRKELWAGLR